MDPEMPTINLSNAAFEELKALAEPFVDTPESLTARLIHEEVVRRGKQSVVPSVSAATPTAAIIQDPMAHESLAHTRLISALIDGVELYRPKWNGVMAYVHALAIRHCGSFDALQRATRTRLRQGRYEEEGFKYLPDVDFSIQWVDANLAWDRTFALVRCIGISITIVFEWRKKEGAVHPGKRGVLKWDPPKSAQVRSPRLANPRQAGDFRKLVLQVPANVSL